jgi:hypothetical protein
LLFYLIGYFSLIICGIRERGSSGTPFPNFRNKSIDESIWRKRVNLFYCKKYSIKWRKARNIHGTLIKSK